MESGNTIGTWIAYGAISLFLLLLFVLFVRTALMVGSVFILAWTRRREQTSDTDDGETPKRE
jgi:hypothetical protein